MLEASVASRLGAGSARSSAFEASVPFFADLAPQLISPIVWQLSFPVLIVDASRRLLYGNHAGRTLLEAGQALVLRGERLDCVSAGDRARLDRALQSCFGVRGGPGGPVAAVAAAMAAMALLAVLAVIAVRATPAPARSLRSAWRLAAAMLL
jgi:hypothetical protein